MPGKIEQLARWTTIVADTGDMDAISEHRPRDATTNPSLLLAVAQQDRFNHLLAEARKLAAQVSAGPDSSLVADCFATVTGHTLTGLIPGLVSTEVDARLSFDTRATVERARRLVALYRELGVEPDRYLIKVAGTWEGIRAADVLETEGIRCNVTLVFNLIQARAAAEAGATLLSPFVGRILDWHVKHRGLEVREPDEDPGVQSVREIYHYLKGRGLNTIVMGASFRNSGQIEALSGCDRLTISPALLAELGADEGELCRRLSPSEVDLLPDEPPLTEPAFRWALNEDPMASDLLADGIRRFTRDQRTLETLLEKQADQE